MEKDKDIQTGHPLFNQELFDFNKEGNLTVGRLKEILTNLPDDWMVIINAPYVIEDGEVLERQAQEVFSIDTYWHGAITFTEV